MLSLSLSLSLSVFLSIPRNYVLCSSVLWLIARLVGLSVCHYFLRVVTLLLSEHLLIHNKLMQRLKFSSAHAHFLLQALPGALKHKCRAHKREGWLPREHHPRHASHPGNSEPGPDCLWPASPSSQPGQMTVLTHIKYLSILYKPIYITPHLKFPVRPSSLVGQSVFHSILKVSLALS